MEWWWWWCWVSDGEVEGRGGGGTGGEGPVQLEGNIGGDVLGALESMSGDVGPPRRAGSRRENRAIPVRGDEVSGRIETRAGLLLDACIPDWALK